MEISDSLPALPFRVDIIARSRAVINRRKNSGDFFLRDITGKFQREVIRTIKARYYHLPALLYK